MKEHWRAVAIMESGEQVLLGLAPSLPDLRVLIDRRIRPSSPQCDFTVDEVMEIAAVEVGFHRLGQWWHYEHDCIGVSIAKNQAKNAIYRRRKLIEANCTQRSVMTGQLSWV